jgi:hypothetical protein
MHQCGTPGRLPQRAQGLQFLPDSLTRASDAVSNVYVLDPSNVGRYVEGVFV